jgi:hypothetical protein
MTRTMHSIVLAPVVPLAAVAAFPQVPGIAAGEQTTPGWVAAAFVGVWVTLWFLDRIGKLPGAAKTEAPQLVVVEPDKLRELLVDPSQVARVHDVVTREDPEKPGYYMVWSTSKERRDLEKKLDDHAKLMHATIATLDAMKRSIATIHKKLDAMNEQRSA